jgi:peptide/nickel transport system permease protein
VAISVLLAISALTFFLTNVAADPALALAGEGASAATVEQIRRQHGFDRPVVIRFAEWLRNAAVGDFGDSYQSRQPVVTLVSQGITRTMTIGVLAILFAALLAIPLGVLAAVYANSWIDRGALAAAVIGQAVPSFWLGLMLIILFGVDLRWFPTSGYGTWVHLVLPVAVLGTAVTPGMMRLTRAGMREVLGSPFIRTCRAKGLSSRSILFKHALRNALIPVVALAAIQFGYLLGGSVIAETVFAIHGIGYMAWEAVILGDLPVIQAIVLIVATIYVSLMLFADLINALLDPRIRVK